MLVVVSAPLVVGVLLVAGKYACEIPLGVDGELSREEFGEEESSAWPVISTAQRGAFGGDDR